MELVFSESVEWPKFSETGKTFQREQTFASALHLTSFSIRIWKGGLLDSFLSNTVQHVVRERSKIKKKFQKESFL